MPDSDRIVKRPLEITVALDPTHPYQPAEQRYETAGGDPVVVRVVTRSREQRNVTSPAGKRDMPAMGGESPYGERACTCPCTCGARA